MGTTAEKLAYLADTKTAIKDAIISKGTDVPEGTTFRQYADLISGISTGLSDDALALADATEDTVFNGRTFYAGDTKEMRTGRALDTPITAVESDVKSGKTYYDNTGKLRTGTRSNYPVELSSGTLILSRRATEYISPPSEWVYMISVLEHDYENQNKHYLLGAFTKDYTNESDYRDFGGAFSLSRSTPSIGSVAPGKMVWVSSSNQIKVIYNQSTPSRLTYKFYGFK